MTQYNIKILTKDYFNVTSQRENDKCIRKECRKLDLKRRNNSNQCVPIILTGLTPE